MSERNDKLNKSDYLLVVKDVAVILVDSALEGCARILGRSVDWERPWWWDR